MLVITDGLTCTKETIPHRRGDDAASTISPLASGHTERSNFHGGCHDKGSFRGIADGKSVVHEPTINNRLVLQHNLVTIAALKALLIPVALMTTVLHLLEIPYHTKFANCCYQVSLLFPILSDLQDNVNVR